MAGGFIMRKLSFNTLPDHSSFGERFRATFLLLPVFILITGSITTSCSGRRNALFTIRDAGETGLHFSNTITENDTLNILRFEYMYNGGGVGVGDFNNDGLPDVFFAGNQVSSKLFLNRGQLQFTDITTAAGITSPYWNTGVSVVDINQDGLLDIYVCSISPVRGRSVPNQFFINQGLKKNSDGLPVPVFKEMAAQLGLDDHSYSTQAVFFDYDLDGDLDCYLLNNALESFNRNELRRPVTDGSGLSTDRLYRNVMSERAKERKADVSFSSLSHSFALPLFEDVSREAGITQEGWGLGVGVGDLNQDGYPDVYCANDFQSNDLAWINQRDGTFRNRIGDMLMHQSHNAMGCDIADINNDGLLDIMTLDMMPFTNQRIKSMFGMPNYDRYELNFQLGYQPQFVRNSLQLNRGCVHPDSLPRFSEIGQLAGVFATDWSWSPLFADFDNDGLRDLFVTNGYPRDVTDLDFMAYNAESTMFGDSASRKRAIGRKMNELAGVRTSNFLFRNGGMDGSAPPTFEDVTERWGISRPSYSNGAAYADFDNDGDLDLIVNNLNGDAFLYQNNLYTSENRAIESTHFIRLNLTDLQTHQPGFGAKVWVHAGSRFWYAEHSPFRGYKSSVEPTIHVGLGRQSRVDSVVVEWPGGQRCLYQKLAIDQTHALTKQTGRPAFSSPLIREQPLFVAAPGPAFRHTENAYTDLNEHVLWRQLYSRSGPYLAKGDVNGDDREDVVVGGSAGSGTTLFVQTSTGQFMSQIIDSAHPQEDCGVLLFDADADKDLDLYVVSGGSESTSNTDAQQDRLYVNDGRGQFTKASACLPNTGASGSCVRTCDFDHDGDLDLFVGGRLDPNQYPAAPRSYLLRNNSRERTQGIQSTTLFDDVTPAMLKNAGMVTDALWADLDKDGWSDLVLAGEFMPILSYKNQHGRLGAAQELLPNASGWWNCLSASDVDHDGDLDILAGNFGLNTRFQATAAEPIRIYAKDYDNNGRIDPILCYYVQGKEVPSHPRDALALQVPALKKKFSTYAKYGSMTFADMLTESERAGGFTVKATELRSFYLENRGQAGFVGKPLPRIAQIAPVNCILVDDFNGDGHVDALLATNQFATDPQIGRQDAGMGQVLLGDGKGSFRETTLARTGLCLAADARSLMALRCGNRKLVLVGCNRGKLETFALQTRSVLH